MILFSQKEEKLELKKNPKDFLKNPLCGIIPTPVEIKSAGIKTFFEKETIQFPS